MKKNYGVNFNIAHIETDSLIYGPGKRFVVWFQGCALACKGCWNQQMWSFQENQLVHRDVLLNQILDTPDIRGITLLGGEPLHQAENIWWLLEQLRLRSSLTVFLFTGFEAVELKRFGYQQRIESLCDIVAMGRYVESQRNIGQHWIGSDNQQVVYPNNSREQEKPKSLNQVEILIEDDSSVRVLGFPTTQLIDDINNC